MVGQAGYVSTARADMKATHMTNHPPAPAANLRMMLIIRVLDWQKMILIQQLPWPTARHI